MLRLLHAGFVAAGVQLAAVVAITMLVVLPAFDGITFQNNGSQPRTPELIWNSVSPFLIWSYLIVATGIAITNSQFIVDTAEYIRIVAKRDHIDRETTLMPLLVCLALPAILLASLALEPPPGLLVEAASYFGHAALAAALWGAAISVAAAGLGAMAHAVKKSLDREVR